MRCGSGAAAASSAGGDPSGRVPSRRYIYSGPPALQDQLPDRYSPPNGCTPTRGADDVAVDVDIAGMDLAGHVGNGFVNAGMHAEGQAIAGAIDGIQQRVRSSRA